MLLDVKDSLGNDRQIVVAGHEEPTDLSGVLTGKNDILLAANSQRAGWFFQNVGRHPMRINELGVDANAPAIKGRGSWIVPPGGVWPPPGFPLTTAAINIAGTAGDDYVLREWSA